MIVIGISVNVNASSFQRYITWSWSITKGRVASIIKQEKKEKCVLFAWYLAFSLFPATPTEKAYVESVSTVVVGGVVGTTGIKVIKLLTCKNIMHAFSVCAVFLAFENFLWLVISYYSECSLYNNTVHRIAHGHVQYKACTMLLHGVNTSC